MDNAKLVRVTRVRRPSSRDAKGELIVQLSEFCPVPVIENWQRLIHVNLDLKSLHHGFAIANREQLGYSRSNRSENLLFLFRGLLS